ncbi:MAG: rhodanese-like domain-containing protein [Cyclobacteriaceae bacterium]|nr:rhodanese-like domain-containing protein [Cyclobacteriaceae bacterium]
MKKLFVVLILVACGEAKQETLLAPKAFEAKISSTKDALVLDVRTEEEVNSGALAGATNIVYDEHFADKLEGLEHKPLFVYCAAGGRSAKAATILRQKGYTVFELDGGIKAWKAAGLPVK